MSDSNEREELIFDRAVSLPESERKAFLDRECAADPALRRRIEDLLRAHDSAGDFMESPAVSLPTADPSPHLRGVVESAGTRIGRYKLLQKIGEGGCGVVWMAEQEEPVRRQVALKIIKLGMDTREVIARFEAERQALAMLDHPNIAKILDAGATETGRPFFVMELVRGIKITEFCDRYNLSTIQRLELFSEVCNAVQHAHQKGIIHRDLKPSNILVTLDGSKPVPKVIDFGIAKATNGRLTDHTLFTAFEQFIGTPAYMSPEQAELSGVDVDTRSDIYSLGVLLYELLTGRLPFDPKTLLQAGLDEIRRIIREVEPPKPSTNLSTLGDSDRVQVAKMRNTDPARLSLLLRGDLDWIVMRCLEKNRTRRYATPNALAADITRHLNNEPVVARPASRLYRLNRLVRRNRLAFAAVVVVSLALVAGSVVSTWQAIRATRAERLAQAERATAVAERSRAEDLLKFMLGDLYERLEKIEKLEVLDAVADKAGSYFSSVGDTELDTATEISRAKVQRLVGQIRVAEGRFPEAVLSFNQAYALSEKISKRQHENVDALFERAGAEVGLAGLYWTQSDFEKAGIWAGRYRETCAALVTLQPNSIERRLDLSDAELNLASLDEVVGNLSRAESGFTDGLSQLEALKLANPGNVEIGKRLARSIDWLGDIDERQGKFPDALLQYNNESAELESVLSSDSKLVDTRWSLAKAQMCAVYVEIITGNYSAARATFARAQASLERLTAYDAKNVDWRCSQLSAKLTDSTLDRLSGDITEASRIIRDTLPQIEDLARQEPENSNASLIRLKVWQIQAQLQSAEDPVEARKAVQHSIDIAQTIIAAGTRSDFDLGECASAFVIAAGLDERLGDRATANREYLRAEDILAPRLKGSTDWHLLDPHARAQAGLGRIREAKATIETLGNFGYKPVNPWPELRGSGGGR